MKVGGSSGGAMTTLRVLRIQTPSVPIASTMAALDTFAPAPKPSAALLDTRSPGVAATAADARSAYAEF